MDKFIEKFKNKYDISDIFNYLEEIQDLECLVIGETIIDEYIYGKVLGRTTKSSCIAFEENIKERYNGGVLAICSHLSDFCEVYLYTGHKQIVKTRYIQNDQKLFEVYSYKEDNPSNINLDISDFDLVLVADFGHGFITEEMRKKIQKESKFTCLNVQWNAGNMGFNSINNYKKWNYCCIDNNELRLATSNQFDDIPTIIQNQFGRKNRIVSVTEGKNGSFVYKKNDLIEIPAFADKVIDSVGAGDAYFSLSSPLAFKNAPLDVIGFIGNIAGSIACSYFGNKKYVTKDGLKHEIKKILS